MSDKKYLKACSLCERGNSYQLIVGSSASICEECWMTCADVIEERVRTDFKDEPMDGHRTPLCGERGRFPGLVMSGAAELIVWYLYVKRAIEDSELEKFVNRCLELEQTITVDVLYAACDGASSVSQERIIQAISGLLAIPWYDLRHTHISRLATHIMKQSICERVKGFPIRVVNGMLEVAVSDPSRHNVQGIIKTHTGYDVLLAVATPTDIAEATARCYIQDWEVGISHDPALKHAMNRAYEKQPS